MPAVPEANPSTSGSEIVHQDLDIQVTVNSSEDEYGDDDLRQSSSESDDGSSSQISESDHHSSSSSDDGHHTPDRAPKGHQSPQRRAVDPPQSEDEFAELRGNPQFEQLVFDILGKKPKSKVKPKKVHKKKVSQHKHKRKGEVVDKNSHHNVPPQTAHTQSKIKSPSDTTIYAPVLARMHEGSPSMVVPNFVNTHYVKS